MRPVEVVQGTGPLVLGLPHTGTYVPPEIAARLNDRGRMLADTDWHVAQLYDELLPETTTVRATFHRYVIDANRDPAGKSLYPGQNTTDLVPLTDFDGHGIWHDPPNASEIEDRRKVFHASYHAAVEAEIARVHDLHGVAILYDCHSIRSHIPYLFSGILPDLNIGTADGATCAPVIEEAVFRLCEAEPGYSSVRNGRFKGGWSTRHYGRPSQGWHALQMELAQSTYLQAEAPPWAYDPSKASALRPMLTRILASLQNLVLNGDLT
ncbi:MAG: N-formylglutamate deformylase [Pseudomonadota bacterium]